MLDFLLKDGQHHVVSDRVRIPGRIDLKAFADMADLNLFIV